PAVLRRPGLQGGRVPPGRGGRARGARPAHLPRLDLRPAGDGGGQDRGLLLVSAPMIRVAVVGAGAWGVNHVRAFARQKGAELVLVCDPSDEALARAGSVAPRARKAKKLEEVLTASDVDAVVLATPAVDHAGQAAAVLEAGKHVLVEKPLALKT